MLGGAIRPKKIPWIVAAIDAGRWFSVSSTMPAQNGTMPRGTILVAVRSAVTETGTNRAANISGPNAISPASRPLSSTGISSSSPRTRCGAMSATSRETFAPSDVPPITAWSAPRWSSSSMTCSPKAVIEYCIGSVGRSERPCPSRSTVTTWKPSAAIARASGWCIRRGISWPWISTTHWSPAPNSVYSTRSSPMKNWPIRSETKVAMGTT